MSPAQVTVWSPSGPSGLTVLRSDKTSQPQPLTTNSHCQLDFFMTIHDFSVFLEVPAVSEPSGVTSS